MLFTVRGLGFLAVGSTLVVLAATAWRAMASGVGYPVGDTLYGFVLGAGMASVPWAAWVVVTSIDGSATLRLGLYGEEQSAEALAALEPEWKVLHHVPFRDGWSGRSWEVDIDHVAVGPAGVLVIETKYTTKHLDLSSDVLPRAVEVAAKQAADNAGRLRSRLGALADDVRVIPMVIFWGRQVVAPSEAVATSVGDARVVAGSDAQRWRSKLRAQRIDAERQAAIVDNIEEYVRRYESTNQASASENEATRHLTDLSRRWSAASITFTAAVAGLVLASARWRWLDSFLGRTLQVAGGFPMLILLLGPAVLAGCGLVTAYRGRVVGRMIARRWPASAFALWATSITALVAAA